VTESESGSKPDQPAASAHAPAAAGATPSRGLRVPWLSIVVALCIFGGALGMVLMLPSEPPPANIEVEEFEYLLAEGRIAELTIYDRGVIEGRVRVEEPAGDAAKPSLADSADAASTNNEGAAEDTETPRTSIAAEPEGLPPDGRFRVLMSAVAMDHEFLTHVMEEFPEVNIQHTD
jgi:hypothetical protein